MSDIKILAGRFRGTKLITLSGSATRPSSSRITESIFNILAHNNFTEHFHFQDQKVLDIFAGSGRLGLEALSRGASRAVFFENNLEARSVIRENIEKCHAAGITKLFTRSALSPESPPPQAKAPFSLIFCDPPYGQNLVEQSLPRFIHQGWIQNGAIFCIETEKDCDSLCIPFLESVDERIYGITKIHFMIYHP